MKVEISTFKITKDEKIIELTAKEAMELWGILNEHYGVNTVGHTYTPLAIPCTNGTFENSTLVTKTN